MTRARKIHQHPKPHPVMSKLPFHTIAISRLGSAVLPEVRNWATTAVERGADALLLREPAVSNRELASWALMLRAELPEGLPVLLRADLLPSAEVHGVFDGIHLTSGFQGKLSKAIRQKWVGVSCHTLHELEMAEAAGAHYVFYSPIFETDTHPNAVPVGLDGLLAARNATNLPVFALGGITAENEASCRAAGAHGVAAIGWFADNLPRIIE